MKTSQRFATAGMMITMEGLERRFSLGDLDALTIEKNTKGPTQCGAFRHNSIALLWLSGFVDSEVLFARVLRSQQSVTYA